MNNVSTSPENPMTDSETLDLDWLHAVALRAWVPIEPEWSLCDDGLSLIDGSENHIATIHDQDHAEHIAAFDPPTVLKLIALARREPEGWVLVPREPTPAMIAATAPQTDPIHRDYVLAQMALHLLPPNENPDIADTLAMIPSDWRAMLAAAPTPPTNPGKVG